MKLKSWQTLLLNEYDLVSVNFIESAKIDPSRLNLIKLGPKRGLWTIRQHGVSPTGGSIAISAPAIYHASWLTYGASPAVYYY